MSQKESGDATEEVQPDAPDPEVEPPGEHGSHLTDGHDRREPETQQENAESSLDQPSQ